MYTYKVINRPAGRSYLKNRELLCQEDEGRERGLPQSTSSETRGATHVHWVSKNVERESTRIISLPFPFSQKRGRNMEDTHPSTRESINIPK